MLLISSIPAVLLLFSNLGWQLAIAASTNNNNQPQGSTSNNNNNPTSATSSNAATSASSSSSNQQQQQQQIVNNATSNALAPLIAANINQLQLNDRIQLQNILYLLSLNNQTNLHEPRIELRYQSNHPFASVDERAPNNSLVAAVVVNDNDSGSNGETSLSIEQGNELGHFKLVSTQFTNTIQVNGAGQISRSRVPEYNLTIVARDHGSPSKSSSVNLVIKINAPLEPQPLKPPVTDLMYVGAMLVVIFSSLIFLIIIACALVQRPKGKKPQGINSNGTRLQHPSEQPFPRSRY